MSGQQTVQDPDLLEPAWTAGGADSSAEAAALASKAFDPYYREAWNEAQIAGLVTGSSAWMELARQGDRLLAFALCRQAVDEVELLLCAVDSDARRRGFGRKLVQLAAERARSRGAVRLFLEVRDGNAAALALYLASGFKESGRRPGYYRTAGGENIDAITLSMDL
jgi:[ribosomal protein S18]-alanine N-acetyltransferase